MNFITALQNDLRMSDQNFRSAFLLKDHRWVCFQKNILAPILIYFLKLLLNFKISLDSIGIL